MFDIKQFNDLECLAQTVCDSGRYPDFHRKYTTIHGEQRRWIEVPDSLATTASILVTMQRGVEAGLAPLTALHNIIYYNNRPCIWGTVALGLVQKHPNYDGHADEEIGTPGTDDWGYQCTMWRITRKGNGGEPDTLVKIVRTFTWKDVRRMGLDKLDHYKSSPGPMMAVRARTQCMTGLFGDALNGLSIAEEMRDVEDSITLEPVKTKAAPVHDEDPFTKQDMAKRNDPEPDLSMLKKDPARDAKVFEVKEPTTGTEVMFKIRAEEELKKFQSMSPKEKGELFHKNVVSMATAIGVQLAEASIWPESRMATDEVKADQKAKNSDIRELLDAQNDVLETKGFTSNDAPYSLSINPEDPIYRPIMATIPIEGLYAKLEAEENKKKPTKKRSRSNKPAGEMVVISQSGVSEMPDDLTPETGEMLEENPLDVIAAAEKTHTERKKCQSCSGAGVIQNPETTDPEDRIMCPDC